jgi:DNA-binding FadR family transcriptional regulator
MTDRPHSVNRTKPVGQSDTHNGSRAALVAPDRSLQRKRPIAIHDAVAHDLGIAIVSGELQPGDLIPGEEKFSADHGISRSAYREAVKLLAGKGLVYSRSRSGTRVSPREAWNMLDLDILAWIFEAGPTTEFINGIFELRRIVEPEAAALAARRRVGRELAGMGHALEEMQRWGLRTIQGRAADERFHALILQATRNEPLIALSSSIAAAVKWTSKFAREDGHQLRDPMPDHFAVFDTLVAGDAKAAREAMRQLVENASADAGIPS